MLEEIVARIRPNLGSAPLLRHVSEDDLAQRYHNFLLMRMRGERLAASRRRIRVAATACWSFPIYSQTFVYQELVQLMRQGFDLRFFYSNLASRDQLPAQFSRLWPAKRKLVLHHTVYEADYQHYLQRMPAKVERLVELVSAASGVSAPELRDHYHFKQAFSFTRMVEAHRPDYLHSYFFYEGTLFTLFASHLLDIPRGVSCYADHLLNDYAFKMVPFHMEQCSVVIATSNRIKQELIAIAPNVDPNKILVKPNAINAQRFPVVTRKEPGPGEPCRLVCVSRIEPKKGIVYLVEATRLLLDRKIPVRVHLLGGVDASESHQRYAEEVKVRIQQLRLEDAVIFEGPKPESEIRRFLQESQLFVAPFIETDSGDKDGIPTALLEAMATGIPTVATDAGSIGEVIEHEKDGVMVPQRDPARLADAIENLLKNRADRQRFGKDAASTIRRRFDVDVCEKLFHERVRTVVSRRREGRNQAPPSFE